MEIIKRAKNPVRFVVRTVSSSTGGPPVMPVTPEVTLNNQVGSFDFKNCLSRLLAGDHASISLRANSPVTCMAIELGDL